MRLKRPAWAFQRCEAKDVRIVHSALLGAAAYRLSWFDAHLWAYADYYGLEEIVSEDFEHGRLYGSVRVSNPFTRT